MRCLISFYQYTRLLKIKLQMDSSSIESNFSLKQENECLRTMISQMIPLILQENTDDNSINIVDLMTDQTKAKNPNILSNEKLISSLKNIKNMGDLSSAFLNLFLENEKSLAIISLLRKKCVSMERKLTCSQHSEHLKLKTAQTLKPNPLVSKETKNEKLDYSVVPKSNFKDNIELHEGSRSLKVKPTLDVVFGREGKSQKASEEISEIDKYIKDLLNIKLSLNSLEMKINKLPKLVSLKLLVFRNKAIDKLSMKLKDIGNIMNKK